MFVLNEMHFLTRAQISRYLDGGKRVLAHPPPPLTRALQYCFALTVFIMGILLCILVYGSFISLSLFVMAITGRFEGLELVNLVLYIKLTTVHCMKQYVCVRYNVLLLLYQCCSEDRFRDLTLMLK